MQFKNQISKKSPWDDVGLLNKTFFVWLFPLYFRGLKKPIQLSDLYKCSADDEAHRVCRKLEKNWLSELSKENPSLVKSLVKTFGWSFTFFLIITLFEEVALKTLQLLFLGFILEFFRTPNDEDYLYTCIAVAGFSVVGIMVVLIHYVVFVYIIRLGMKMRVALCCLIYKKALKLNRTALGETTIGQVINLVTNDVSRFDQLMNYGNYAVICPLQVAVVAYLMYQQIGYSAFTGLGLMIGIMLIQMIFGRLFSSIRSKTAQLTDTRIRLMNEIISGMRVIKMYAWEKPFDQLISDVRKKEMRRIQFGYFLKAVNSAMSLSSMKFIIFVSFFVYILTGGQLNSTAVFYTTALYGILKLFIMFLAIQFMAETKISCQRIKKFLLLKEIGNNQITDESDNEENYKEKFGIHLMDITTACERDSNFAMKNLTVDVKEGELLVVVGPVGSGKTSLLMALLNELPLKSGRIKVTGKVSYASQEGFTFNGSVRDNILFDTIFERRKYNKVVDVCALKKDFKLFPFGDKTLVGERGVMLSGGQRARITLARAIYCDADVFLLDDPLSAVDTEVAKHIFEKCIMKYLKNKIRILVTHQLQFIKKANKILVLKDGKCLALGSYEELLKSGVDFLSLIDKSKSEEKKESKEAIPIIEESAVDELISSLEKSISMSLQKSDQQNDPKIADEQKDVGTIGVNIYWTYFKTGAGTLFMGLIILLSLFTQLIFMANDLLLTYWTNEVQRVDNEEELAFESNSTDVLDEFKSKEDLYTILYAAVTTVLLIASFFRVWTWYLMCNFSSIRLHNNIFYRILRAPIYFFDLNPVGRILNRFSRDLGTVDETIPDVSFDLYVIILQCIGVFIMVSFVQPILLVSAFILILLIIRIRGAYISTARDIKRYESIARSPLYSHLTTTLNGLTTIRAFGLEKKFINYFYNYQNEHTACWFLVLSSTRALGFLVDLIAVIYTISVAVIMILFYEQIPGGSAGLALSSAMTLTGMTQWGIRQSTELETQMTSVERILEYSHLEPEAELESSPDKKPNKDWPESGEIEFVNVSVTYSSNLKPALNNLSFKIFGGEKIGVVGRTGAGKSSLLAVLFRMCEPSGVIRIDEVDTKTIGLHDLRKNISIIPQEPVVFTGSVRRNIDPFGDNSDDKLWQVLEDVQLKEVVRDLPNQLDTELTEGGSNFSMGQRQLVCLARAILRHNKILVLDEATANVDHHTDSLIQQTIRDKFSGCTVVTIAHRLNTIIDCDKVLVLDSGSIVEFDEPFVLLQDEDSMFKRMVDQTGPVLAKKLFDSAQNAHSNRNLMKLF